MNPEERDHTLTADCWCNPEIVHVDRRPKGASGEQASWDPGNHEHIEGFHKHQHPHTSDVHSNMNGLVGKGENTGNTFVSGEGIEPAIVGEPPDAKTS